MAGRLRKVGRWIAWGLLLVVAFLGGAGWYLYSYATDSDTIIELVHEHSPKFFPGSRIDMTRARVRPFAGEVTLTQLTMRQVNEGTPKLLARCAWASIKFDPWEFAHGKFKPSEVRVAQPLLQLRRREDGTWNLQGVLADPFPAPKDAVLPPVTIEQGKVELVTGPDNKATAVLRDVTLHITPGPDALALFEGSARGDQFDRIRLEGSFDRKSGRVVLKGDLNRLTLSETLRDRIPAEYQRAIQEMGISGGEADVTLHSLVLDPDASPRVRYDADARIKSASWKCPKLPFDLDDVSAHLALADGKLTIHSARGRNGATELDATGWMELGDPEVAPFNVTLEAMDLQLDRRLCRWTPAEHRGLWADYAPRVLSGELASAGRVNAAVRAQRDVPGGKVGFGLGVRFLDVSIYYKHFPYLLEHVSGSLTRENDLVTIDMHTLVGGKPLRAWGTVENPGPRSSIVKLDFEGESLPVDRNLFNALPPDVRPVVESYHPSGTVRGKARLVRLPPLTEKDDPKGRVTIDAYLDLNPGCAMTWDGLKYPISNLTGRLELHPESWVFKNMKGYNGQATIRGDGRVVRKGGPKDFQVALHLEADSLPFDHQLRDALPPAWQKSWATINPTGSCDVVADITSEPGQPPHHHIEIHPGNQTGVRLEFERVATPGVDPGGKFEMRMEDVSGLFVFNDGEVGMFDVGFLFHGAPVRFKNGTVQVEDSGKFSLGVRQLEVKDLRMDGRIRGLMPPVMAEFARKLDDGKAFRMKGDLGLGWSGKAGAPAWCQWQDGKVIFEGNSVQAGIPLEQIQGQLQDVEGMFDGQALAVKGTLNLDSVILMEQQVTRLTAGIVVDKGKASVTGIKGALLGGEVHGDLAVTLDKTPEFTTHVVVEGADLQRYARTLPGKQTFKGLISGEILLRGQGNDLHRLNGSGNARITQGDLGHLPVLLRFFKVIKLARDTKTAFDSAFVTFKIENGVTDLDPIDFIGDAFSLRGRGTLDVQGTLDVKLCVVYGRDKYRLFFVSDLIREASGQFVTVYIRGTPALPQFGLEAVPAVSDFLRSLGSRKDQRDERRR